MTPPKPLLEVRDLAVRFPLPAAGLFGRGREAKGGTAQLVPWMGEDGAGVTLAVVR